MRMAVRRAGIPVSGTAPRNDAPALHHIVAAAVLVAGAAADELTGSGLGRLFALGAAAAAALAVRSCARPQLWWVLTAPPPAIAAVAVCAELLTGAFGRTGTPTPATAALHWAVDTFPAMVAAETAMLAVLVVRAIRSGREIRTGREKRTGVV